MSEVEDDAPYLRYLSMGMYRMLFPRPWQYGDVLRRQAGHRIPGDPVVEMHPVIFIRYIDETRSGFIGLARDDRFVGLLVSDWEKE